MTLYADVILPLPLDQPYTYSLPKEMEAKARVGSRVLVPLGERWLTGIVIGLRKRKPQRATPQTPPPHRRGFADPSFGPDGKPYKVPEYLRNQCYIDDGYGRFSACNNRI